MGFAVVRSRHPLKDRIWVKLKQGWQSRTTVMKHRNSHFAVGYWSLIRHGRTSPDQSDIDPKALKRLLPFVFLLDGRQGTFTYRLAGTTLCARYGGELRGRDFLAPWDADSRIRLDKLMRQALAESSPLCLHSIGASEDCRMVEIETVLMPIRFGGQAPDRFLGVAQILTDIAPLVCRCISFERLVHGSLIREGETQTEQHPPSPPPPPPPPPPPSIGRRSASRGSHLRLVKNSAAEDTLQFDGGKDFAAIIAAAGAAFACPESMF